MRPATANRRQFLHRSGAVAVAVAAGGIVGGSLPGTARCKLAGTIRLGGPSFSTSADPDEQAQAHRRLGYRAAYCPGVDLKDETRIHDIERAFARHDVVIAEVGRWVNLLDADAAKRAANLHTVTDGLRLAELVGARCCVDIAGSFHPTICTGRTPGT